MKFLEINGLKDVCPEKVEGTEEWYYCKLAQDTFCDLYEAEEIVNEGNIYQGMNCVLIHYPDGTVYSPFSLKQNTYVEAPVFWEGLLYFLVADFEARQIQIVSFDAKKYVKDVIAQISLDEIGDCYNLMLRVAPVTLIRYEKEEVLEIVWPEKKKIEMAENEVLIFRDGKDLYFSAWYEEPDYHEKTIVRDMDTGETKQCYDGQMHRMPNGDIWIL